MWRNIIPSCLLDPSIVNITGKSCWPTIAGGCFDERRCSIGSSASHRLDWDATSDAMMISAVTLRFDGVVMRELWFVRVMIQIWFVHGLVDFRSFASAWAFVNCNPLN